MGNRAVITFSQHKTAPCIYLHWNGGRASVEAFIKSAKHLGLHVCKNEYEEHKVMDLLAEMIATHFFETKVGMTVYREQYGRSDTSNSDNGVYVLDSKLNICKRIMNGSQEEIDHKKTEAIFENIVSRAPAFNF
jgi:hypothetical protein